MTVINFKPTEAVAEQDKQQNTGEHLLLGRVLAGNKDNNNNNKTNLPLLTTDNTCVVVGFRGEVGCLAKITRVHFGSGVFSICCVILVAPNCCSNLAPTLVYKGEKCFCWRSTRGLFGTDFFFFGGENVYLY